MIKKRKYTSKKVKNDEVGNGKLTKMGIHALSQFYADGKQLSEFSDEKVVAFTKAVGLSIQNMPDSYGIVLNNSQKRVLEGILKVFSDTNYNGEEEIDKITYSSQIYPINKAQEAYKNVDSVPIIRLTQSEIIELSGYDKRQSDKTHVIDAITFLGTKLFCFYWVRLKTDSSQKPVKGKNGEYAKEEVMEVSSLFRIRIIRENGELQYYEIHPSAVILDQINNKYGGNYFLLVPNNWKDEVKKLTGKNASSYTYEFLLWLRLQYEQIRRYNVKKTAKKAFEIIKSWEDIAITLKMPETIYKANRKKASKIIQDAYSVAIKLGYLLEVKNDDLVDILYLNEDYYPKLGELV